jgi:hypothetical protein
LSIIEENTLQIFAQSEQRAKKIIYLKFRRMPRPGRQTFRHHATAFDRCINRCASTWREGCFFGPGNSPFTMSHDSMVHPSGRDRSAQCLPDGRAPALGFV